MRYCVKCKVTIAGNRTRCPLCQAETQEKGGSQNEMFPVIPTVYRQYHLFFRILLFISLVVGIVSVMVNFLLFAESGIWAVFILAGIACLWFNIAFAVRKRSNILKNIIYQVIAMSLTALFWDFITGWHKWSIAFVIPILFLVSLLAMLIVAIVMKQYMEDQIIYFVIDSLLGLLPLLTVFFGRVKTVLPSVLSGAASLITFSALLVFQWEVLKSEMKRRMHV